MVINDEFSQIANQVLDTHKYQMSRGYAYLATVLMDIMECNRAIDILVASGQHGSVYMLLKNQIERILVLYKRYVISSHINTVGQWTISSVFHEVYNLLVGSNYKSPNALITAVEGIWNKGHVIIHPDKIKINENAIEVYSKDVITKYDIYRSHNLNILQSDVNLIKNCLIAVLYYIISIGAKL